MTNAVIKNFLTNSAVALLVLAMTLPGCVDQPSVLLVQNAMIYDGLGNAPYSGQIAISEGVIVAIGPSIDVKASDTIDAKGMAVAPGFIDLHAHIEPLPLLPEAESFIRQGVTTTLGGPDGSSVLPMAEYLDSLERMRTGINVGYLVGQGSVRANVMALDSRQPDQHELDSMKRIVAESMDAGAFGISTGLKYLPGTFSSTDEIIALSQVAADAGGIYTSHLRDEGLKLMQGVDEAIEISRQANMTVVLTHHKAIGEPMWGSSVRTLAKVDSARAAGLDVRIDQYPYTASYTSMAVLIPAWALEGGRYNKFAERCKDPVLRDSIRNGIIFNIRYDRGGNDLNRIQIAKFAWKPELQGKTLYDWATQEGLEPTAENGADLVIKAQLHGGANCIYHVMAEEDVVRIMQHPMTMHASDGRLSEMGKGHPHPRAFGTFPRVLGEYVRERGTLSLPEALRKMTSLPAETMGLKNRGVLREGNAADLVVFDPQTIADVATFEDPHHYPVGIYYVLVNGQVALDNGHFTAIRAGHVLRGPAYR